VKEVTLTKDTKINNHTFKKGETIKVCNNVYESIKDSIKVKTSKKAVED